MDEDDFIHYDPPEDTACPMCGSQDFTLLGALGVRSWCRCRDCGFDFAPEGDWAEFEAQAERQAQTQVAHGPEEVTS